MTTGTEPIRLGAAQANISPSWPMHLVGMGREFIAHDGERFSYAGRDEPWGPVDGSVDVVQFVEPDTRRTVAQWWNYGCHACSLSWDFNQISADYPGALRRHVTHSLEAPFPIAFFSGCTGNVQTTGMKRFSSPPQMYLGVPKGDFEMVERLGACVAVVFTPLEVTWQIGSRIREQSPFPVTLISTTSLGFESYLTESKFYQLEPEQRPYETFGLQAMAGFTYSPATPAAFEQAVIAELEKIHKGTAW